MERWLNISESVAFAEDSSFTPSPHTIVQNHLQPQSRGSDTFFSLLGHRIDVIHVHTYMQAHTIIIFFNLKDREQKLEFEISANVKRI